MRYKAEYTQYGTEYMLNMTVTRNYVAQSMSTSIMDAISHGWQINGRMLGRWRGIRRRLLLFLGFLQARDDGFPSFLLLGRKILRSSRVSSRRWG